MKIIRDKKIVSISSLPLSWGCRKYILTICSSSILYEAKNFPAPSWFALGCDLTFSIFGAIKLAADFKFGQFFYYNNDANITPTVANLSYWPVILSIVTNFFYQFLLLCLLQHSVRLLPNFCYYYLQQWQLYVHEFCWNCCHNTDSDAAMQIMWFREFFNPLP
jgi:hypothetical protein